LSNTDLVRKRDLEVEALYADVIPPEFSKPANFRRKSNILSFAICAFILPGLLATVVLPVYGASAAPSKSSQAFTTLERLETVDQQSVDVLSTDDQSPALTRDTFGLIPPPPPPKPVAALASASTRSLDANPALPGYDLSSIVTIASQYLGVPYIFGGESPSGFDCSGLVEYVYAQVGISLPHSSRRQGNIGTPIARSAALPGDVVVMDGGSHVGIYIGGGRFIDAPEPGRVVSNDLIYDNNYYIVRFGIG
jgi:cell wall-associated NlpC family hydrolase